MRLPREPAESAFNSIWVVCPRNSRIFVPQLAHHTPRNQRLQSVWAADYVITSCIFTQVHDVAAGGGRIPHPLRRHDAVPPGHALPAARAAHGGRRDAQPSAGARARVAVLPQPVALQRRPPRALPRRGRDHHCRPRHLQGEAAAGRRGGQGQGCAPPLLASGPRMLPPLRFCISCSVPPHIRIAVLTTRT